MTTFPHCLCFRRENILQLLLEHIESLYTHTHTYTLTGAAELVALDLCNAFVGEAPGAGAACPACLYGVWTQEVGQPLHITVTHEGVLGQVADGKSQGGARHQLDETERSEGEQS